MQEFVLELHDQPRSWLRLPRPFAREMEGRHLHGLWLRVDGCCNGPMWVTIETSNNGITYLTHGWKSFARAHCLGQGHLLHFKLDGPDMLVMKFFGASGAHLECCAESSSDSDTTSSSDAEDDDNDGDDDGSSGVKIEDDGEESG